MGRKIPENYLGEMSNTERNEIPPALLFPADLIFNTTTQTMQVWNGSTWLEVGAGGGLPNHKHTSDLNDGGNALGKPGEAIIFSGPVVVGDGAGQSIQVPKLTTAERNALIASDGMIIYNTTTNQFERYQNGAWGSFSGGFSGIPMTSVPILNNQAVPLLLFRYDAMLFPFSFILMSVKRGSAYKIINTQVVTDGVTAVGGMNVNTQPSPDATGVTITRGVVAGFVEYYYTSTNTGVAGTFEYGFVNQWA